MTFFVHSDQTIALQNAARYVGTFFHREFRRKTLGIIDVGKKFHDIQITIGNDNPIDLLVFPEAEFFEGIVLQSTIEGYWNIKCSYSYNDGLSLTNGVDIAFHWDVVPMTF